MPSYQFNGLDLIKDVEGKNYIKWALKCSLILFTKQDLIENCIVKSKKSTRGELDPIKVLLLKGIIYIIIYSF